MSLDHAATLLAEGDPHRLRCVLAAPVAARPALVALYALNLEIARAAWASAEPMVGEMRLQWWRDAVAEIVTGQAPRTHPVLQTAAPFLQADPGAGALWDGLIEARRWDLWREGFADDAALWAHLEATAGALTWLAARALGAPEAARPVVVAQALAGGLADWIAAFPDLRARGRHPLPNPAPKALRALAATGLSHHAKARAGRAGLPRAACPALWPHAGAATRLRRVLAVPEALLAPDAAPLAAAPRHALWAAVLLNRC